MLVAIILLTRAQAAKPVNVVVIYRPTGKTYMKWMAESSNQRISFITDPKDQGQRQHSGLCMDWNPENWDVLLPSQPGAQFGESHVIYDLCLINYIIFHTICPLPMTSPLLCKRYHFSKITFTKWRSPQYLTSEWGSEPHNQKHSCKI